MSVDPIDECLKIVEFDKDKEREAIMQDAFTDWEDFSTLTEKDLSELADAFSK